MRRNSRPAGLAGLSAALFLVCGPARGQDSEAIPETRETATDAEDQGAVPSHMPVWHLPLEIPDDARALTNPLPAVDEVMESGEILFVARCGMCHGARGRGDGDLSERLGYVMPDFGDPAHQQRRTDGELHYIITHGHGKMRGEEFRIPEDWKWRMIHYIRSLER